ncbi:MAG: class I tRNA ligase family protein [Acidimicrobiales bacterium]
MAKTQQLVAQTTQRLDAYDLAGACAVVQNYLDALTNWYIRRSRERFWNAEGGSVDAHALDTLYTVLVTLTKVLAPLMPMIAEEIWQGLVGESSVHPVTGPRGRRPSADADLVAAMDLLRAAVTPALALREPRPVHGRHWPRPFSPVPSRTRPSNPKQLLADESTSRTSSSA